MNNIKLDKRTIITFLISAFIIAICHNLKIDNYFKNVIIPFIILILSYIYLFKLTKNINKKAYYLLIPIILILTSNLIIKIDYTNQLLNIIILPILITIFFMSLINKNYNISNDFALWVFKLFPKNLFNNLKFLKLNKSKTKNNFSKIILGITIGFGIGLVILCLLTSADAYFNSFINQITGKIHFNFSNIFIFVISFIILFSIFINILLNENTKMQKIKIHNFDKLTVSIILIIINIIFVLFLISEISRLTVNFLQIPIEYTYASYAREGFFQLLFVTLINFSLIMFLLYKSNVIKDNITIKKLIILLICFSIVLIFNSYYRMYLYISHYGFTILRLQVTLFLLMELIIFIMVIKKIMTGLSNDALIYFIIMLSFYIVNIYLCNENFIALI